MANTSGNAGRKPSATRRQTPSSRQNTPPTLNTSHLQGFVVGCVTGILCCVGILKALESDEQTTDTAPAPPPTEAVEAGPRFDFYTVLPNQELDPNAAGSISGLRSGTVSIASGLVSPRR